MKRIAMIWVTWFALLVTTLSISPLASFAQAATVGDMAAQHAMSAAQTMSESAPMADHSCCDAEPSVTAVGLHQSTSQSASASTPMLDCDQQCADCMHACHASVALLWQLKVDWQLPSSYRLTTQVQLPTDVFLSAIKPPIIA